MRVDPTLVLTPISLFGDFRLVENCVLPSVFNTAG